MTSNRHFGYRVANEISRFVVLAMDQTGGSSEAVWSAFDLSVLEKVLPKLHGTQQELGEVLNQILEFAIYGQNNPSIDIEKLDTRWRVENLKLVPALPANESEPDTPFLPRTALKVYSMLRRLQTQGFTSFIE